MPLDPVVSLVFLVSKYSRGSFFAESCSDSEAAWPCSDDQDIGCVGDCLVWHSSGHSASLVERFLLYKSVRWIYLVMLLSLYIFYHMYSCAPKQTIDRNQGPLLISKYLEGTNGTVGGYNVATYLAGE